MSTLAMIMAKKVAAGAVVVPAAAPPDLDDALSGLHPKLQAKMRIARGDVAKASNYAEITRITGLPVTAPMTPAENEAFNRMVLQASAFDSGFRLFPEQANGLLAVMEYGNLFAPIPVGGGKTLLNLMCANYLYAEGGKRKIVMLAPSSVMSQLIKTDIAWARRRVSIQFPVHVLHGKSPVARRRIASTGAPGVYIFSYPLLSTQDADEILWSIEPDAILCDEAQNIKDRSSARTRRLMRYVEKHSPTGIALSGTITSKSIEDYSHIIRWCLGRNSPLPLSTSMAREWAAVIDAGAGTPTMAAADVGDAGAGGAGPLTPLVQWAKDLDPQGNYPMTRSGFRSAYRMRLQTAPGVVSGGDEDLGVSLIFANRPVPYEQHPDWPKLKDLLSKIEKLYLTPNDDEIEHAIHMYKWLYELSAGFYNQLLWPEPEEYAKRKGVSASNAADQIERAKVHHHAGQEYAKALRSFLESKGSPGLDTPMLVGLDMSHNGDKNVDPTMYRLWSEWKALDFDGRPDRDAHAVRVCSYKIDEAVKWACKLPPGVGAIVWVHHQEIGRWAFEALQTAGVNTLHCPAGDPHNDSIRDLANANKVVIASITAHGTGKNLQHFEHQYVLQWPRPASTAEQMIGRTHRNGQKADEIVVVTNNSIPFDRANFGACLNDSLYIHQTTGTRQKLIIGTHDPLPMIYPPEMLIEKGFRNRRLSSEQLDLLKEKFGGA